MIVDRAARIDDRLCESRAILIAAQSRVTLIAQQSKAAAEIRPDIALQLGTRGIPGKPDSPDAYGALLQQRLYWRGIDRPYPQAGEINEVSPLWMEA